MPEFHALIFSESASRGHETLGRMEKVKEAQPRLPDSAPLGIIFLVSLWGRWWGTWRPAGDDGSGHGTDGAAPVAARDRGG